MKVLWLGMNDEGGCVLHWHKLRLHLRDEFGVVLKGPGYSWQAGTGHQVLSKVIDDDYDWIVLDDCNAMGYVPVVMDGRPSCNIAWREHDWHNRQRKQIAARWKPDVVLGCYDRPFEASSRLGDPHKEGNWFLVPHPIDTETFHPGNGQERIYNVGAYGREHWESYPYRTAAMKQVRRRQKGDAWIPVHGGYWKDGRGSGKQTFYHGKLADALRQVKCAVVAGGQWKGCVLKFFEAAACGCLLIGQRPFNAERYFPADFMVDCQWEKINDVVDWYADHESVRETTANVVTDYVLKHHSIEARAAQIMEVLRA